MIVATDGSVISMPFRLLCSDLIHDNEPVLGDRQLCGKVLVCCAIVEEPELFRKILSCTVATPTILVPSSCLPMIAARFSAHSLEAFGPAKVLTELK